MTNELSQSLYQIYMESLETNIIAYLAEILQIDIRKAVHIYYNSLMCSQIHEGSYGIQYLDYKNLAEDIVENEIKNIP